MAVRGLTGLCRLAVRRLAVHGLLLLRRLLLLARATARGDEHG